jgi:hypothetical protein
MNRFVLAVVLCGLAVSAVPAAAQQQQAAEAQTAPTPAPNQFTDPAMSFTAPNGYYKANIPPHDPTDFDQPTVVAAFANRGAARVITIQMESFTGSLSGFEMVTENELRNQIDGVFFKNKQLTTLSNGMPAYWQEITMGSGFQTAKRFEYVWIDGVRGIVLSITGRYGEITEDDAKKALANASGVAYPRNRY